MCPPRVLPAQPGAIRPLRRAGLAGRSTPPQPPPRSPPRALHKRAPQSAGRGAWGGGRGVLKPPLPQCRPPSWDLQEAGGGSALWVGGGGSHLPGRGWGGREGRVQGAGLGWGGPVAMPGGRLGFRRQPLGVWMGALGTAHACPSPQTAMELHSELSSLKPSKPLPPHPHSTHPPMQSRTSAPANRLCSGLCPGPTYPQPRRSAHPGAPSTRGEPSARLTPDSLPDHPGCPSTGVSRTHPVVWDTDPPPEL